MIAKRPYQAYAAAMQTMAGTRQIVMLYDGVLRYLHQAREAMREKRIEDRFNNLTRASEIVFGLQGCLDFERGGEVANVLYGFYASIDGRIFALHRTNDIVACEHIIAELRQMRDVWDAIDRESDAAAPPADAQAPAAPPPPPAGDVSGIALSA